MVTCITYTAMGNRITRFRMERRVRKRWNIYTKGKVDEFEPCLNIHKLSTEKIPIIVAKHRVGKELEPNVYDGDTFVAIAETKKLFPDRYVMFKVRVSGMNAPEMGHRAESEEEMQLAPLARQELLNHLQYQPCIEIVRPDCYGRYVARVYNDKGDITPMMIDAGMAIQYDGKGKATWSTKE